MDLLSAPEEGPMIIITSFNVSLAAFPNNPYYGVRGGINKWSRMGSDNLWVYYQNHRGGNGRD